MLIWFVIIVDLVFPWESFRKWGINTLPLVYFSKTAGLKNFIFYMYLSRWCYRTVLSFNNISFSFLLLSVSYIFFFFTFFLLLSFISCFYNVAALHISNVNFKDDLILY